MATASPHTLTSVVGRPTQSFCFEGSVQIPAHARIPSDSLDPEEDDDPYGVYRPGSHKVMLEKALSRAHAAVILDKHRNYEGAIEAYRDACNLIQQVMQSQVIGEEKGKLDEIYESYSLRIIELEQTNHETKLCDEKMLPALPTTDSFLSDILSECGSEEYSNVQYYEEENAVSHVASDVAAESNESTGYITQHKPGSTSYSHIPPMRTSLSATANAGVDHTGVCPPASLAPPRLASRTGSRRHASSSSIASQTDGKNNNHQHQYRHHGAIEHLLSRNCLSPQPPLSPCSMASSRASTHCRGRSNESASWLGTIDETAVPEALTPHRSGESISDHYADNLSDDAADGFDFVAAVDDAVDAAYDDRSDNGDYFSDHIGTVDGCGTNELARPNADNDLDAEDNGMCCLQRNKRALSGGKKHWDESDKSDSWDHADPTNTNKKEDQASQRKTGDEQSISEFKFGFTDSPSDSTQPGKPLNNQKRGPINSDYHGSNSTSGTPNNDPAQGASSTSLPTVTEDFETDVSQVTVKEKEMSPSQCELLSEKLLPAPTEALPAPPVLGTSYPSSNLCPPPTPPAQSCAKLSSGNQLGVRSRRLKGNAKLLSINVNAPAGNENNSSTSGALFSPFPPPTLPPPSVPTTLSTINSPRQTGETNAASSDETELSRKTVAPQSSSHLENQKIKGLTIDGPSARASPVPSGAPSPTLTRTTSKSSDNVVPETLQSHGQPTNITITATEHHSHSVTKSEKQRLAEPKLKKNISSSNLRSLRGLRHRGVSFSGSNNDNCSSVFTPATPITEDSPVNNFALERKCSPNTTGSQQAVPPTPTSIGAPIIPIRPPIPVTASIYEMALHDPVIQDAWNSDSIDAPYPLEACPQTALLRPYWLMRCIYQTIAHPRGGYLTTKLFIPKVVWQVNNVKLKAVPDKISCCNLLTAALHKLAEVDMNDANAVNSEMQALEGLLDQVQSTLTKKLGNEVGAHGAAALFKPHGGTDDFAGGSISGGSDAHSYKSGSSSKSYFTPWRKLRSKSSGASGAAGIESVPTNRDMSRDGLTMSTLPMMDSMNFRGAKRYPAQIQYAGPNASYMSAVARLCDAAQVLGESFPVPSVFLLPSLESPICSCEGSRQKNTDNHLAPARML
ncbi:hypothetical protein KEM54_006386 [Ascosphaera aggregata]|nr:hypothetical protein KEM54_006386 [Ascosphaera aggregata]